MNTATFNQVKGISTTDMTKVFEIKIGNKYQPVRATSMVALNEWCSVNGVSNWRMAGMMSRTEIEKSQNLKIVA